MPQTKVADEHSEIKADLPVNASDPSTNVSRKAGAKFDVTTECKHALWWSHGEALTWLYSP